MALFPYWELLHNQGNSTGQPLLVAGPQVKIVLKHVSRKPISAKSQESDIQKQLVIT